MTIKKDKKTQVRTWIVLGIIVFIIVAAIFGIYYWRKTSALESGASVASAPRIESIPGAGTPSVQYVKDQTIQNAQNVAKARKKGTSAIPTLTRSNFQGNLNFLNSENPKNCKIIEEGGRIIHRPGDCSVANMQKARDAGVKAEELSCLGCSCPVLKQVGYTAGDMKNAGFTAKNLRKCGYTLKQLKLAGFTAKDLKSAGFSAAQLKAAGFTAAQLKNAGFSAKQLKAAGFTAKQLADAGFSAADLKRAGFTAAQIKAAGLNKKLVLKTTKKNCSVSRLKKERAAGISATALKDQGCGLAALKAAGYTAAELKNAGFTAKQLKAAGFSAKQLKAAGFSAKQLKNAGFTAAQLKNAGFSAKALKAAGFSAKQLKAAGFSAKALKAAGFSAKQLKAAGFTAGQLKAAGFSAKALKAAGFSAKQLRDAGFSAADLKKAGFTPDQLRKAGFTTGDLLRAGFTPAEAGLGQSAAGFTNCSVAALRQARNAGLSASYLKDKGCNETALRAAGYTPEELQAAGFTPIGGNLATESNAMQSSVQLPSINDNSPEAQLQRIRQLQEEEMSRQQRQNMLAQMQAQMNSQAQNAVNTSVSASGSANASGISGQASATASGNIIKAGTIMFAVLDTGINSDEPSPILAHIVNGPLKGAKLVGSFQRRDQRVVVSFSLLNASNYPNSISINAVAIDPNTARTALADSVNNHYLLRYGTLFASSFLSGLSQAIQSSGSTQTNSLILPVITRDKLNTADKMQVALGNVGTQYAEQMKGNFNTPPTVKVNAGAGIGILFMSDLSLPIKTQSNQ